MSALMELSETYGTLFDLIYAHVMPKEMQVDTLFTKLFWFLSGTISLSISQYLNKRKVIESI